jgi:hypothetical protein
MKTLLQVLVGLALCAVLGYVLIYSNFPMSWEHEEPLQPHVYSLTWRSGVMLGLLLVATQAISFILFRRILIGRRPMFREK